MLDTPALMTDDTEGLHQRLSDITDVAGVQMLATEYGLALGSALRSDDPRANDESRRSALEFRIEDGIVEVLMWSRHNGAPGLGLAHVHDGVVAATAGFSRSGPFEHLDNGDPVPVGGVDLVVDPDEGTARLRQATGITRRVAPARTQLRALALGASLAIPFGYSRRIDVTTACAFRGGYEYSVLLPSRRGRSPQHLANDRWNNLIGDSPFPPVALASDADSCGVIMEMLRVA